jgi:hypothetical protein
MPIIEANTVGRPIKTSKISSTPEIAGDTASLVNPYSIKVISKGINKIKRNLEYRENSVNLGFLMLKM